MKKERGYFIFALLSLVVLVSLMSSVSAITDAEAQALGYLDADEYYDVNVDVDIGGIADEDARLLGSFDSSRFSASEFGRTVSGWIDVAAQGSAPIFSKLLGDTSSGDMLFARVLFLILIFSVVYAGMKAADFFKDAKWVSVVVGFIVAIFATRWLASANLIETVILPYSVLGITIAAGIPFLTYFWVVEKGISSPTLRRFAWTAFGVVFVGLWISRYAELSARGQSGAMLIYPATAALCLLMAVLDGSIHKFFSKVEFEKYGVDSNKNLQIELRRRLVETKQDLTAGVITAQEYDDITKDLKKKYAKIISP